MRKTALLLIDLQIDFCPGGRLPVPEGDCVIPVANQWIRDSGALTMVASKDWHPATHLSFASNHPHHQVGDVVEVEGLSQILWPDHCVQGSDGARLHPALNVDAIDKIVLKGENPLYDSYSVFFDNGHRTKTDLDDYLRSLEVRDLYLLGLATDYCVLYTALDARRLGYNVRLVEAGCRGVNLDPNDSNCAIQQMRDAGVEILD